MKMTSIFKKASVFAIAITLILLMVVSILPAAFAEDSGAPVQEAEHNEKLNASNVSLSGSITMMFYYKGLEGFADNDYIQITVPQEDGKEPKIITRTKAWLEANGKYDAVKQRWLVEVPVAYAQQSDKVTMQWFKDGKGGKVRQKTVRDYYDKVAGLAASEAEANKSLPENKQTDTYISIVSPLKSMLNAGAMAQTLFGHNSSNLSNNGIYEDNSNPIADMTAEHFYDVTARTEHDNTDTKIEFFGGSVLLQNTVSMRIYFSCPDSVTTANVYKGDVSDNKVKTVKIKTDENDPGRKYVTITNINATQFDVRFTVEVAGLNGQSAKFEYSVLDYALNAMNSHVASEALKNTAKSLYLFYAGMKDYTDDSYVPGPKQKDENGDLVTDGSGNLVAAECTHERTHTEAGKGIVCSDCGVTVKESATKITATVTVPDVIRAGTPADISVTYVVSDAADLTGLVLTSKFEDSAPITLTYKSLVNGDGYECTADENVVILPADEGGVFSGKTLVTVTYTVTASEEGVYKLSTLVREASTQASGDLDAAAIANTFITNTPSIEVKPALCADHDEQYVNNGDTHTVHCPNCKQVLEDQVAHSYTYTSTESYDLLICGSICPCGSAQTAHKYAIGKDADGNAKAPLVVVTPEQLGVRLLKKELKTEGDITYASYTVKEKKSDPSVVILSANEKITGQYVAIKYRTNNGTTANTFIGANNGYTAPKGGVDEASLGMNSKLMVPDGQWRVAIIDLSTVFSKSVNPEEDGTTYSIDYFRWDVLKGVDVGDSYVDVAYAAFSDDYMSLASFASNDTYVYQPASSVYLSGSAVTGNPVFDSNWLANGGNSNSGSQKPGVLTHKVDSANNGLTYVEFTKQEGQGNDSCLTLHANTDYTLHTSENANYVGFMYRGSLSSSMQIYINSNLNKASGTGDHIWIPAANRATDGKWHFMVLSLADIKDQSKTAYFDPAAGISTLRFDYWNGVSGVTTADLEDGTNLLDLAFVGIFDSAAQAYECLGNYTTTYLTVEGGQGCMHDASAKSEEDCCMYCVYCGAKTAEASHTTASVWAPVIENNGNADGKLYEEKTCSVCNTQIEVREIAQKLSLSFVYINGTQYTNAAFDKDAASLTTSTSKVGVGAWLAINGGIDRHVYRIIDEDGSVGAWINADTTNASFFNLEESDPHVKAVNDANLGITNYGTNGGFNGGVQTVSLQEYLGETITIEFGAVPANNPGLEDAPNVITYKTIKSVKVVCDHTSNTNTDYVTLAHDPQHEHLTCSACGAVASSRQVTKTPQGLTLLTPDSLDGLSTASLNKSLHAENGLNYYRATSSRTNTGESYLYLSLGNPNLTGVGKYVALMFRKPTGTVITSSSLELFVSPGGKTTSGSHKNLSASYTPSNDWQLLIFDYSSYSTYMTTDTGIGWTRLDIFNSGVGGETADLAWIGFFNNKADAYALFDQYSAAYNGCTHYDESKLENITEITTDGSVFTATADCTLCGAKGVNVILETLEGLKIFTPGELFPTYKAPNSCTLSGTSFAVVTNDKTVNGMPYIRYTKRAATGEIYTMLNQGTEALTGVGKYVAIYYRRNAATAEYQAKTDKFEVFLSPAGYSAAGNHMNLTSSSELMNGEWHLAIIDFSALDMSNGLGWSRLDIFNDNHAIGKTVDIAYVGFFSSSAEATAYNAKFLYTYGLYECDHSIEYTYTATDDFLTYNVNCGICGEFIETKTGINQEGLTVLTPDQLIDAGSVVVDVDIETSVAPITVGTNAFYNDLSYIRITGNKLPENRGEAFLYLKFPDKVQNVGKYIAVIYRSSGIACHSLYVNSASTGISSGHDGKVLTTWTSHSTDWKLMVYDFTAKTNWDNTTGVGTFRFGFGANTIFHGNYLDIAYIGFFNSQEEANAFYAAATEEHKLNENEAEGVYRVHYDTNVKVNGESLGSFGSINNRMYEFDLSKSGKVSNITAYGWFVTASGTKNYRIVITDENGNTEEITWTGNNQTGSTGHQSAASGMGLADEGWTALRGASLSYDLSSNLKKYSGQIVTIDVYAHTYDERTILITRFINVEGPGACEHVWVDADCDTPKTCSECGETEGEALGHNEVPHDAKAPTCTEIGWDAYVTCSRCDYTTYSEKAALGHTFADADSDYLKTCSVCGTIVNQEGLEVLNADRLTEKAIYQEGVSGVPVCGSVTKHTSTFHNGLEYVDISTTRTTASSYVHFQIPGKTTAGNYVAIIYRSWNLNNGSLYVRTEETNSMSAQHGAKKVDGYSWNSQSLTWKMMVYDISAIAGLQNGVGTIRFDIGQNILGRHIEIAYISFFNSTEEAEAFYAAAAEEYKLDEYELGSINRVQIDNLYINGTNIKGTYSSTGNDLTHVYDLSGYEAVDQIQIGGWFITASGTKNFKFVITDENGNKETVTWVGGNQTGSTGHQGVADGMGLKDEGWTSLRGASLGYTLTSKLTKYGGQTVSATLYAETYDGRTLELVRFINVNVPQNENYIGKYKTYVNSVYINGVEAHGAKSGENATVTFDFSQYTLTSATSMNWGGWYIIEGGTTKYVYTIIDAEGNRTEREYVGGDYHTSSGHITAAESYGLDANALKGGAISTTFDLSGFEGQTVTVEVYAVNPTGYKVLSTVFNNVKIAEADPVYTAGNYRTQYNYINVNGTKRSNGSAVSKVYTFDCKGFTLNTPTSMSTSGWFIAESGTQKFVYTIIDKYGNMVSKEYTGSNMTGNSDLKGIAEGLGITASGDTDCRKGAGSSVTFDLTGYEGQTVTIKLYAVTNNGDKILSTVITNVAIAAAQ